MRTKLKLLLVLASFGLLALAMSGPASAGKIHEGIFEAGDPMTTNVPYVAWAGEEVRLVKCTEDPLFFDLEDGDAEWAIVDSSVRQRTGDLRDPVFFDDADRRTSSFDGAGEQDGRVCWAIDIESVHPGMTRVKMAVDGDDGVQGSPILKHDFLIIWLGMNSPTLTELGESAFPGIDLGDPDGGNPATFTPRDIDGDGDLEFGRGLIRVGVTGSFNDLHDTPRTLPADWAALAGVYAFDQSGYNPMRWDIHDDQLETEGHTPTSFCLPPKTATIDAVDNCLGSFGLGEIGPQSRVVGGTFATVGPFDPARPGTSFLPDGKLDAGDAPMPAARIDLTLTGGVGALEEADKHEIYSRDRLGTVNDPATAAVEGAHNLYAPFYAALIPADASQLADDVYTTSGTHGAIPNNFPGYQVGPFANFLGVYHYWDFVNEGTRNGVNTCRDVGGTGQFGPGEFIPLPAGVDEATVYTDEHGEALAWFNPDVGAALVASNQGLCDLGPVNGPALLGTATINAEAMDPFQLTFNAPRLATPLVKNVNELAGKSLDCIPKSPIEAFCVEVIRDIRGNAVEGAPVAFSREPRGLMAPGSLAIAPYDTRGQEVVSVTDNRIVIRTNELGQAGIVVKSTLPGLVDIDAENIGTINGGFGVQRVRCIRFAGDGVTLPTDGPTCVAPTDGGTTIPTPPPGGGTGTPLPTVNQPAAQQGAAATVVSLAGNPVPAAAAPAAKKPVAKAAALKLTSARLVFKGGKRYLVVRVNGAAKTAKVRITLVMRTGKATKPVVRTIRTNAAVRVANLQVGKHVRTVRVALAR
jgi:hypothetical protein